jgi:glycosyltransferase involved in cell wall biosynthesis
MPELIEREASRLRLVALIHLPLGADIAMNPDAAVRLEEGERRALAPVSLVIVTGAATLNMLAGSDVRRDRIVVVEPGTDQQRLARGSTGGPIQILTVATLHPGKGHVLLLQALAGVTGPDWRLVCAGSLTRHPATVDRVRSTLETLRLEGRVSLVGELDDNRLAAYYDTTDVFALATRQETYGMAVAEALAHGVPVVSTATGAIAALVGDDAGVVVPPDDVEALTCALRRVLGDAGVRARLTAGARRARGRLRTWGDAAREFSAALALVHTNG